MIRIITGESKISLRIVDWFATNYAKKNYTLYPIADVNGQTIRFKVYFDYKLKLKAYSKKRFDPFCRWDRISIPYKNGTCIETTIGQLNFFKWAIENCIIEYINDYLKLIDDDMLHEYTRSLLQQELAVSHDVPLVPAASFIKQDSGIVKMKRQNFHSKSMSSTQYKAVVKIEYN